MSDTPDSGSRLGRGLDLLPVLAALALHAVTHDRWLLCAPAAVGMAASVARGWRPEHTARKLLLAAGAGAGVGALLLLWSDMPGPIPPALMGPMCGALVGLSAFCALSGRQSYAITYALLLTSLSAAVPGTKGAYLGLLGVALGFLVSAFRHGRMGPAGAVGVLGFGAFVLVTVGATFAMGSFVRFSEVALTQVLFRMAAQSPKGFSMPREISLERRGRMPETQRLLFELRGDLPKLLRTTVLDAFDGTRWTTSSALEAERLTLAPPSQGELLRATELTLLESLSPHLPAPAGTRAIEGASPRVHGGWLLRTDRLKEGTVTLKYEPRAQLPAEPRPASGLTSLPDALRAELRPLALELTRGATTPTAQAKALEAWFREKYEYSLSVNLEGEGSPLAVLIRERRPAWCVYFASAMAALLRSLDVPARVAGGFVPQEKNPFTGAFLVRDRDAHAWVEVYLEDEGRFVAFDPTPWRSREAIDAQQTPGTVKAALQAASSTLRRWFSRLMDSPLEALRSLAQSPWLWLVVVAVAAWRWRVKHRRAGPTRQRAAMRGTDAGLAEAYARYLRAMKREAGLVPGPAETDEELLSRLREARGANVARLAEEFISLYRRARYGGGPVDPASLGTLAAEFDRTLRQERPRD
jgi:hypothetical protein